MKRIIAVLDLLPKRCPENVRQSYEAAAERWDAEVLWLTERLGSAHPISQKMTVCGEVQKRFGASRVLQLDNDLVIRSDCPSPFDLAGQDKFAMVSCYQSLDRQTDAASWVHRVHTQWSSVLEVPTAPAWLHPNGGIYLYSTEHFTPMFDAILHKVLQRLEAGEFVSDECLIINRLWHNHRQAIEYLPLNFDVTLPQYDVWMRNPVMQTYIYHYVSHAKEYLPHCRWQRGPNPEVPYADNQRTMEITNQLENTTKLHLEIDNQQDAQTIANLLSLYPSLEISFTIKAGEKSTSISEIKEDQHLMQMLATHTVHLLLPSVLQLAGVNANRLTYIPATPV